MGNLARISRLNQAVARVETVEEGIDLRDKIQLVLDLCKKRGAKLEQQNEAAEAKVRLERKLGAMIKPYFRWGVKKKFKSSHDGSSSKALRECGITFNDSSRWRCIEAIPEQKFEAMLAELRQAMSEITSALFILTGRQYLKRSKLAEQISEAEALTQEEAERPKPAQIVVADPPWAYDFAETERRAIENQYPTMSEEEIVANPPNCETDSVLFLWATAPKLEMALRVMAAWGFQYKTNAVWDKEKKGMGYWFRGQHELLLVGVKGNFSPPPEPLRLSSVFRYPRARHSKKPDQIYDAIAGMFPSSADKLLEMYQRGKRKGWMGSGNQSGI